MNARLFAKQALALAALALGVSACAPFKLEQAPSGYAQVQSYSTMSHYKAGDDVGAKIQSFNNVKGGTLAYWAEDLVDKLSTRGYTLTAQNAVTSKNGIEGVRFDFDYVPPGDQNLLKFYSVVLFATDQYRVVVQLAGEADAKARHADEATRIARELKVRGCKRVKDTVCGSPSPPSLVGKYSVELAPGQNAIATDDDPEDAPDAESVDVQAP